MTPHRTPFLERVLLALIRGPGAEFVIGDILERYQEDVRSGMDARRAKRRLRRQVLASLWTARAGVRRETRLGGGDGMGSITHDVGVAFRRLARRPAFALGVALTLGLGIGATTTIYSVVDGVLLSPLAFDEPKALVAVGTVFPGREWEEGSDDLQHLAGTSMLNFWDLRARSRSFEGLAAVEQMTVLLTDQGDGPEIVSSAAVTAEFFSLLGTGPVLGRSFLPEEFSAGGEAVFMITYAAWQRRFGGNPDVLGRPLDRVGIPATIVGVLPMDFEPPEAFFRTTPDFWAPLETDHERYADRGRRGASIVGRLAAGVTLDEARVEAGLIADELARAFPDGNVYPDGSWFGIGVNGLREQTVGTTGRTLWIFMGAAALLLLLATLNAATMLLARSLDRLRELGVRVALGAGRLQVIRLLVTEAGVLAALGGVLGISLAFAGVEAFLRYAPSSIPRTSAVALDGRVLFAAVGVSLGTGILAGLLPALQLTSRAPWARLQSAGRSVAETGSRLRSALLGGQIALAVLLLCGAGLLVTSFSKIRSVHPGFVPEGLLSMNVAIKRPYAPEGEAMWQGWDAAIAEVAAVPGVAAVAGTSNTPFQDPSWAPRILLPGEPPETRREGVAGYSVTPGYLEAVGTRLVSGRDFGSGDGPDGPLVALVNETFVRVHLAGADPLGMEIRHSDGDDLRSVQVVGVVEDVVQARADQGARAAVYFPYTQFEWPLVQIVVRSELATETLVPELRRSVARFNAYVPPRDVATLEARMAGTRTTPLFQTLLLGAFAVIAILLAGAGLYGSLAHSVGRRRRELGVRMALGAARSGVLWMVLREGIGVSGLGLGVGIITALAVTRVLRGYLYEVAPTDPMTFVGVSLLLLLVSVAASVLPARRATGVDPAEVLRSE